MPAAKMKAGKTVVTLYQKEQANLRATMDTLLFIERNSDKKCGGADAAAARQAIDSVLKAVCQVEGSESTVAGKVG